MRKVNINVPEDSDGPVVVRHYDLNGALQGRYEIQPGQSHPIEGEAGLRFEAATPIVVVEPQPEPAPV